ncbi:MAG: TIR domain-containing protein, partial [Deltaproteobacteria bacterium]|nr:TIR domain-containing protein [Deltaproteobacteria bacterium]
MSDVFVSYAREDREWVQRLAAVLAGQGFSIWWDREMVAGDDISAAIETELSRAKCVIVVWSETSIQSHWVRGEAERGCDRKVLLPVRIADVELPLPFGEIHTVNLTGWNGDPAEGELESLLRGIRRNCGGQTPPEPTPIADRVETRRQRAAFKWQWPLAAASAIAAIALGFHFLSREGDRAVAAPAQPAIPGARTDPAAPSAATTTLRTAGALLTAPAVEVMLVQNGFYDLLRNPSGKGVAHRYEAVAKGDAVLVRDAATGLLWQKTGVGEKGADHDGAEREIKELNDSSYGGFADWRLPTLDEAMSLMEPKALDFGELECHFDPILGRGRFFVWTADMSAPDSGWIAYYCDGYARSEGISFNAYVRAVRSERAATAAVQNTDRLPPVP